MNENIYNFNNNLIKYGGQFARENAAPAGAAKIV